MIRLAKYIKNSRGQAMVEFAIILPVLISIVIGVLEFGLILNQHLVLAEAARQGARTAALGGSDAEAIATARQMAAGIDRGALTVTVNPSARQRGDSVSVTVANPINIITPLIGELFPANYSVQGTAIMRVE